MVVLYWIDIIREVRQMAKYPNISVELIGKNGNAFYIIGKVLEALKEAGYKNGADKYLQEAISGDYNDLLRTTMKYVNIK